jgi:polysaccharide transporter, PST family
MLHKLNSVIENLSPNIRKIIANMSWLIGGRVLRAVVGFVVAAWMARYLGVNQFGILNYAFALTAIFANIAQMGMSHFVLRDSVSEPPHRYEILGTAVVIQLISGISSFLLLIGVIFLLRPDDPLARMIVIIMSSSLIFQSLSDNIDSWFQSQVQSKYSILSNYIAFLVATVGRVILIQVQAPLIAFAFLILAENILATTNFIIAYQSTGQKIQKWRANWSRGIRLVKLSWPLIFSSLSVMIYLNVDQIMLGQLADSHAVGIYAVAVKLSENWAWLVLSITRSVTPYIMEAKKVSEEAYYQRLQKLCNLLALIFYILAIPLTFFATPIVVFVFGENYAPAGVILSIHIWSSIWVFFGNVQQIWIATEELTVFAMTASFIGAIMNIVLNFWLIPIYKEMGSAIATVISYFFAEYVVCFIYPPARKFGWVMTKALALNIFVQKKQELQK